MDHKVTRSFQQALINFNLAEASHGSKPLENLPALRRLLSELLLRTQMPKGTKLGRVKQMAGLGDINN